VGRERRWSGGTRRPARGRCHRSRPGTLTSSDRVRARLTAEREQTQSRIAALQAEFGSLVDAADGSNIDDEHDPEGATIAFERAQVTALLDQARTRVRDLDRALDQLAALTYGRCERCGTPIAAGRLQARPSARTCITCASA
jgi:RNA polymerase-binding transcription factor DksA